MHFLALFVCSAHVVDFAAPEAETTCLPREKGGKFGPMIVVQGPKHERKSTASLPFLEWKETRNFTSGEGFHGTGGSLAKGHRMLDFCEDYGGKFFILEGLSGTELKIP